MIEPSDPRRFWSRSRSICFNSKSVRYAAFSNMTEGFPIEVDGERFASVEHLYQASRFPDHPARRALVLAESTAFGAKRRARRAAPNETRPDWDEVKVAIMARCLRLKAEQHPNAFVGRLLRTEELPLVEESRRDNFWGAIPINDDVLQGRNVLGLLLMDLRAEHTA